MPQFRNLFFTWALLSVFMMVGFAAHKSVKESHGLRRRLSDTPPEELAAEYERVAAREPAQKSFSVEEISKRKRKKSKFMNHGIKETPVDHVAKIRTHKTKNKKSSENGDLEEQIVKQEAQEKTESQKASTAKSQSDEEQPAQESNVTPTQIKAVTSTVQQSQQEREATEILTKLHDDMCSEWWNAPPLPYENCDPNAPVNSIALFGGLTNALKLILLGAVGSWEENRCFIVDESESHLNPPDKDGVRHGFIHKYMEPIGLPLDHPLVVKAREENRIEKRDWSEFWTAMSARRAYGQVSKLPNLGFGEIEGHDLKRSLIRRMWRPHQKYRQSSCSAMEDTHGLKAGEYIAFSVRRGDKSEEKFAFTELKHYVDEVQKHLHRFDSFVSDHIVPKIFVATDDCSVMSEFREMRPNWTFVSECDVEDNSKAAAQNGFALRDFKDWGAVAEDAHFTKFFTEIYALTMSKVFIGVGYTNVAWWVYFLRPFRHSFILLDKPKGQPDERVFNFW